MEIKIKFSSGGYLELKWEPMAPYKFYSLVWGIVLCVIATSFFAIWK